MSGAEVVAVLSIGASVIAVVDACNKLIDRIKEFRGSAAFVSLRSRLQLFSSNIKSLDKITSTGVAFDEEEQLLRDVLQGCKDTIEELDSLLTSLLPEPNASAWKKTRHTVRAFLKDHRVRTVLEELQEYQNTILFHLGSKTEQNTRKAVFLLQEQKMALQMQQLSMNGDALSSRPAQDSSSALYHRQQKHVPEAISCIFKDCRCFCHSQPCVVGFTGRITGISTCRCQGVQYLVRTTVLQKLFQVSLAASWSNGLSVGCSMKFKNMVRDNNPGFELVKKCVQADGITFEEARAGLLALRDSGVIDFNDFNQIGLGYFEVLCWYGSAREQSVNLARFLTQEGVHWKFLFRSFVGEGSLWTIREGPKVDLMRVLPPVDIDPWWHKLAPEMGRDGPDPFHIMGFTQICLAQVDFGSYKPLHAAVATNAVNEVKRLVEAQRRTDITQNNLGHTVLHLAIQWPCVLQILLQNGYKSAVDSTDWNRVTPLWYALCYGCTESIDILVDAGASLPEVHANWVQSTCWAYAATACDEEPFLRLMDHYIRKFAPMRVCSEVLMPLIFTKFEHKPWNLTISRRLVAEIEKWTESYPHDFRRKGETPLHLAMTPEHARVLMSYDGFDINSQTEKHGETALMMYCWFLDPQLIHETLACGARVNATDPWGRNALHYTFSRTLSCRSSRTMAFHAEKLNAVIRVAIVLAAAGGDLFQRDKCRCFCSPSGCSPLRAFVPVKPLRGDHHMVHIWIFELFVVLQSCGKSGICDLLINDIGRFQRADEIGITHTCCASKTSPSGVLVRSEIALLHMNWEFQRLANDWEEIREEESDLGLQLDQLCLEDSTSNGGSWESRLVSILARRCVMMDTIDETRSHRSSCNRDKEERLSFERCIEKYITSTKDAESHLMRVIPKYDHGYWMKERERICQLLLEEVQSMRVEAGIKQGWDIENWVEGTANEGFAINEGIFSVWMSFMPVERI